MRELLRRHRCSEGRKLNVALRVEHIGASVLEGIPSPKARGVLVNVAGIYAEIEIGIRMLNVNVAHKVRRQNLIEKKLRVGQRFAAGELQCANYEEEDEEFYVHFGFGFGLFVNDRHFTGLNLKKLERELRRRGQPGRPALPPRRRS